jgi:hypothetical protein
MIGKDGRGKDEPYFITAPGIQKIFMTVPFQNPCGIEKRPGQAPGWKLPKPSEGAPREKYRPVERGNQQSLERVPKLG